MRLNYMMLTVAFASTKLCICTLFFLLNFWELLKVWSQLYAFNADETIWQPANCWKLNRNQASSALFAWTWHRHTGSDKDGALSWVELASAEWFSLAFIALVFETRHSALEPDTSFDKEWGCLMMTKCVQLAAAECGLNYSVNAHLEMFFLGTSSL